MKKIILKTAKTKESKSKSGITFYVLLFVAIVTVGTTAHIIRTKNDYLPEPSLNEHPREMATVPLPPQMEVAVKSAESIETASESAETSTVFVDESQWQSDDVILVTEKITDEVEPEPIAVTVSAPVTSMQSPVSGEILKPHSDTELSYSKTMEDWRLHKGVDIAAPIGTTVIASAKGTVSDCYTDTACGVTVVIDHGNGIMTKYSNLASSKMVEPNQSIESGTAIGVVGDTAEFEVADEAHLHFEVIKNGISVNPSDYIG